jgi:hypothetical protein
MTLPDTGKLIQVTIKLNESDYRAFSKKAAELNGKTAGNVSTASLIRHAMRRQKEAILNLKTI